MGVISSGLYTFIIMVEIAPLHTNLLWCVKIDPHLGTVRLLLPSYIAFSRVIQISKAIKNSNQLFSIAANRWRWKRFTLWMSTGTVDLLLHKALSATSFGRFWKQFIGSPYIAMISTFQSETPDGAVGLPLIKLSYQNFRIWIW